MFRGIQIQVNGDSDIVAGNIIGTPDGVTLPATRLDDGIFVGGNNDTVGGSNAAERNIISGNKTGVGTDGANTSIVNNYIGINLSGTSALPNDTGVLAEAFRAESLRTLSRKFHDGHIGFRVQHLDALE